MQTLINLVVAFVIISWVIVGIGQILLLCGQPGNDKELVAKVRLMCLPVWARILIVLLSPVIVVWNNLLVSILVAAVAAYCCL